MYPRIGSTSPWGEIESIDFIDDGILFVTTPGHGGVWLAPQHHHKLPTTYKPFTQDLTWAEEDIDAGIVLTALGYNPRTFEKQS